MTITIDLYVNYNLHYYQAYPVNQKVAEIFFHAGDLGFDNDYYNGVSGVGIDPVNPDPPNEIFATIEDAIDHYKSDMQDSILTNLNNYSNDTYVFSGNIILVSPQVNAALNLKQDVITPSAHISNGATDANTSQATNYNVLSGLLGIAGGLNDANSAQNDLATKYNDLAGKFNTLLAYLEAQGIQAS